MSTSTGVHLLPPSSPGGGTSISATSPTGGDFFEKLGLDASLNLEWQTTLTDVAIDGFGAIIGNSGTAYPFMVVSDPSGRIAYVPMSAFPNARVLCTFYVDIDLGYVNNPLYTGYWSTDGSGNLTRDTDQYPGGTIALPPTPAAITSFLLAGYTDTSFTVPVTDVGWTSEAVLRWASSVFLIQLGPTNTWQVPLLGYVQGIVAQQTQQITGNTNLSFELSSIDGSAVLGDANFSTSLAVDVAAAATSIFIPNQGNTIRVQRGKPILIDDGTNSETRVVSYVNSGSPNDEIVVTVGLTNGYSATAPPTTISSSSNEWLLELPLSTTRPGEIASIVATSTSPVIITPSTSNLGGAGNYVTTYAWAANLLTLTMNAAHGLTAADIGRRVALRYFFPSAVNDYYVIASVPSTTTIRLTDTTNPGAFVSGGDALIFDETLTDDSAPTFVLSSPGQFYTLLADAANGTWWVVGS